MKAFEQFWAEQSQRNQSLDAAGWVFLGWSGHEKEARGPAIPCEAEDGELHLRAGDGGAYGGRGVNKFIPFPKMPRLSREIIITEKIDGTNAIVFIGDDGEFLIGSRSRWITPEEDNFGFARWATDNKEELTKLGPGYHFGEWWGSGIQRGYGLTKGEKRFSLFNTGRWLDAENTYPIEFEVGKEMAPACSRVVPILYSGPFREAAIIHALNNLSTHGSKASPGFNSPEGVVIYHTAARISFKKTILKDEAPKSRP